MQICCTFAFYFWCSCQVSEDYGLPVNQYDCTNPKRPLCPSTAARCELHFFDESATALAWRKAQRPWPGLVSHLVLASYGRDLVADTSWRKQRVSLAFLASSRSLCCRKDRYPSERVGRRCLEDGSRKMQPAKTLAQMLARPDVAVPPCDVMLKMDVESAEWGSFKNADLATLRRFNQIAVRGDRCVLRA